MSDERPIIYIAPDAKMIRQYVQIVSHQLAKSEDSDFQNQEVIGGFAQFLVFIAQFEVRQRNEEENDNQQ